MTFETAIVVVAAVCAALAGGVYFTFSAMILPAFRILPAAQAISAMRRVNIVAVRAPFMVIFFGGALGGIVVLGSQLAFGGMLESGPVRALGAALVLVGFVITIVRNVPLNTALAIESPSTEARWGEFDRRWGGANVARAVASITGAVALAASLTTVA